MGGFAGIAGLLLFIASLYQLGRAYGWSAWRAIFVALAAIFLPLVVVGTVAETSVGAVVEQIFFVAIIVPQIVLFALSMAVSRRVADHRRDSGGDVRQ